MKAARLVVLGIALAAGGLAALLAGRSKTPPPEPAPVVQLETVDVLVADSEIGRGTAVKAGELRWQTWPAASAGPNFIRKPDRPDAIEQLSGSIARGSFSADEPIQEARLIKAGASGYLAAVLPRGMRAVSTEISAETSAGGFVIPGDSVDVILTRRDQAAEKQGGGGETFVSETILSNVRVLAVDQTVDDPKGEKSMIGKTVTLEVNPGQAESLALGKQLGTLSLSLRSIVDTAPGSDIDRNANRDTGINIVRFGVSTKAAPK